MASRSRGYDAVIAAPFGRVGICVESKRIVDIQFLSDRSPLKTPRDAFAKQVCGALRKYFSNPRSSLRLPVQLQGSDHQQRVWRALIRIPSGRVKSYGELARELKSSARAIGGACRSNPIAIVVPCHRVVAAGDMGGFMGQQSGSALKIKRWLLTHEQQS